MQEIMLLTATVRPNVEVRLAVSDPVDRLRQYQEAVAATRARVRSGVGLVIVETSHARKSDLVARLSAAERKATRVISFDGSSVDAARGKGFVEAAAVQFALSEIVASSGEETTVHKLTGRLVLENAARVLQPADWPVVRVRMTVDRSFADTRLISARAVDWREVVLSESSSIDEPNGVYIEHTVAAGLARAAALRRVSLERFGARPRIIGQSGSTGAAYRGERFRVMANAAYFAEKRIASLAARKQV